MDKSYEQGRQDGIALYGRVCSRQSGCADCTLGLVKGDGLTCQEFIQKFPGKAVSLLTEMDVEEYTYYNEYVTRFPYCGLSLEDLSNVCCRKAIFEGDVACEGGDCKECWSEKYISDISLQ